MNSLNIPNKLSLTETVCQTISEFGWLYELEDNKLQLVFTADEGVVIDVVTCVIDVLNDKLFLSTALGIKAKDKSELLELLNYINANKIYYGRYIIANDNSIWFDYSVDLKLHDVSPDLIHRVIIISVNSACKFCNIITDVAIGKSTAEETILKLK